MAESIAKTRVIGYVRVSTEMQASEGVSLDAQQARLRAYAAALDLDLVRIEQDAGFSAKNLDRPALKSALGALDEGQAAGLLVYKLDRLTRRVLDLAHLIERYFGERFSLLSVADSIDTRTAGGRLVLNVLASAAQWERETIGERVRDAHRHLREQGVRLGHPPFGWQWNGERDERGHLVVREVPEEQETIRRASQLRLQGCTLDEVATALTADGRKPKGGGHWQAGPLRLILKRAEVPVPTREQVAARRKGLGVWWSTARSPVVIAADETVDLAVALREEGFSLDQIAHILAAEGHKPLRGRFFHGRSVGVLLQNVDPKHLRRRGHVRERYQLGAELIASSVVPQAERADGREPTLARIVELRTQGCTLREIAARLAEEGHAPKHAAKWSHTTLSQMLRKAGVAIPKRRPHGIDPFGFERVDSALAGEQVDGLRPVPREIETIKRAVALREQGKTLDQVALILNDEALPTKRGFRWSSSSVGRVLHRVVDFEPARITLADTLKGSNARNLTFGWARQDGQTKPRPVPSQQATIRKAVELRRRGCSLPEIVQKLNREGHATQRGRLWHTGSVLKILRREGALHAPTPIQSGRVPYGWERASGLDPRGTRGLRPVRAEQAAIRRMIGLRLSGRSLNEIAGTMERESRPTKYGAQWSSAVVAKILSRTDAAPSHHPSRAVPFGWRRTVKGAGTAGEPLAPDPAEQETLKRAITLWRQGHGSKAIARILHEEGRATRCGGPWHPATIQAIVTRARANGPADGRATGVVLPRRT